MGEGTVWEPRYREFGESLGVVVMASFKVFMSVNGVKVCVVGG